MTAMNWWLRHGWALNLALLALVSVSSARALNAYVASRAEPAARAHELVAPAPGPAWSAAPSTLIAERDLFNAVPAPAATALEGPATPAAEPLPLKLIGTAVWGPGDPDNLASIQDLRTKKIEVYAAGEPVADGATLEEIQGDRVVIQRAGATVELRLEGRNQPPSDAPAVHAGPRRPERVNAFSRYVEQTGANSYRVARAGIERAFSENAFITDVRGAPRFIGEGAERKLAGFQIIQVRKGGICEALGLLNGDVLTAINGQAPETVEAVLGLFSSLRTAPRLALTVERDGRPTEFSYTIE